VQRAFVLFYRRWGQAYAASSLEAYVRGILVNVYLEDRRGWWSRWVTPSAEPRSDTSGADAGARVGST
jgi:hypothetical protein